MTRDRHLIPETDHVMAMKSLIEGEEYSFRATGNRMGASMGQTGKMKDPYQRSFMPGSEGEPKDSVMAACERMKNDLDGTKWRMWLKYEASISLYKERLKLPGQMNRQEWELQELRNRLLMEVGAEPQTAYGF